MIIIRNMLMLFPLLMYANSIKIVNGGVLEIQSNKSFIIFNKNKYLPITGNNFILPIAYKIKQKTYKINLENETIKVKITQGNYKKEILKVAKSKINLNKAQINRAIKEARIVRGIYKKYIPKQWFKKFIYPLDSKQTSFYGNRRIFNNKLKSYHSGLDFRAKKGTEIQSSNDGLVVFAGDLFYAGKCVIVNHGKGIFTIYAHLSKLSANINDKVKRKDIIGLSGRSGRVTGAHLHFGVILNSIKVNPIDFIKAVNKF